MLFCESFSGQLSYLRGCVLGVIKKVVKFFEPFKVSQENLKKNWIKEKLQFKIF